MFKRHGVKICLDLVYWFFITLYCESRSVTDVTFVTDIYTYFRVYRIKGLLYSRALINISITIVIPSVTPVTDLYICQILDNKASATDYGIFW